MYRTIHHPRCDAIAKDERGSPLESRLLLAIKRERERDKENRLERIIFEIEKSLLSAYVV